MYSVIEEECVWYTFPSEMCFVFPYLFWKKDWVDSFQSTWSHVLQMVVNLHVLPPWSQDGVIYPSFRTCRNLANLESYHQIYIVFFWTVKQFYLIWSIFVADKSTWQDKWRTRRFYVHAPMDFGHRQEYNDSPGTTCYQHNASYCCCPFNCTQKCKHFSILFSVFFFLQIFQKYSNCLKHERGMMVPKIDIFVTWHDIILETHWQVIKTRSHLESNSNRLLADRFMSTQRKTQLWEGGVSVWCAPIELVGTCAGESLYREVLMWVGWDAGLC